MFIYLITNLINGKKYIGQTKKTIEHRWKAHYKKDAYDKTKKNYPLYLAIKNNKEYKGYRWEKVLDTDTKQTENLSDFKPLIRIIAAENVHTGDIKIYKSKKEAVMDGFSHSKIGPCLKGHYGRKTHKGYKFYYKTISYSA